MQAGRGGDTACHSGKQSCEVLTEFALSYTLAFCTHFFVHIQELWFCQNEGLKNVT